MAFIRCLYGDCDVIGQVDVLTWLEGCLFDHHTGSVKAGIAIVEGVPPDTELARLALRTDTTTFWIVDAFPSDAERQEHLEGAIASSLLANAERLLDGPPEILPAEVLAAKLPQ
jgi:hypothetical protein